MLYTMLQLMVLVLSVNFIFVNQAWGYIDPNTGGYVFQVLFPIFSALGAALIFFRNKIKSTFKRIIGKSDTPIEKSLDNKS